MSVENRNDFFDILQVSRHTNVQKPYFAFQKLWQDGTALVGNFAGEQPLGNEIGPLTTGEMGRHMAILGSCAAVALHNGSEGYYLATKAHLIRKDTRQHSEDNLFHASAQVMNIDKRTLKASIQVWNKEPLAELICEYTLLSPALFQRKFQNYASDNVSIPLSSPYQHVLPLYNLTFEEGKLDAFAGPLSPQQCAGHFFGYPCWPVAIIAQTAFQVTGELIKKQYGETARFCVQDLKLSADKLMKADSILKFSIEIMPAPEPSGLIKSVVNVYHDNERVVQIVNMLQVILAE
ncbi:hypothetical protein [uncultured Cedecea sp.]|uniref:hypothetical protein n=1 Tax=uncultured Cedecea sp. TaxID=988762 RepID=UPI00262CE534|nr:hypothetical protein [uncultured Cedecea sp.]